MKKLTWLLGILLFFVATSTFASEHSSGEVKLTKLYPISAVRPSSTGSQNMVFAYFDNAAWSTTTNCATTVAMINSEDEHLLSILMAAWAAGKKVEIGVETTLPLYSGNVCQVVWIVVK